MTKEFFKHGRITQPADAFTPGFLQCVVAGLVRYAGTARESASGAERPLSVVIAGDSRESTEWILRGLDEALETVGVEHGVAGILPAAALNFAFFEMNADYAIYVGDVDSDAGQNSIRIFERGDMVGGLEAVLPGGVNFKGAGADRSGADLSGRSSVCDFGLPLSVHGMNAVEAALSSGAGFSYTAPVEYSEDLHDDAADRYARHVVRYVNTIGSSAASGHQPLDLTGVRIALDCANGALSGLAAEIFDSFHAEVAEISSENRYNLKINSGCGVVSPERLQTVVKDNGLDYGFAFSGDGSEILMADGSGALVDGEKILAVTAGWLGLPKVVVSGTATDGLKKYLAAQQISFETAPDDGRVFNAMKTSGALLGGTKNTIVLPGEPLPDGLLAALVMSKIMTESARDYQKNAVFGLNVKKGTA